MMFMEDSERAADIARQHGANVGLHLNLTQPYNGRVAAAARETHRKVANFLTRTKFAVVLYHPGLRASFREVFQVQLREFVRLYGTEPTHVDGHQHRHLCENLLLDEVIPHGVKVRRNFSFFPGEKAFVNRIYRRVIDWRLSRSHRVTDYFFSLSQCLHTKTQDRVFRLARTASVELMTHPINPLEHAYLNSDIHKTMLSSVQLCSYAHI